MGVIFQRILEEAAALSWIDWTVTITAIIYLVLAMRQNEWCWVWGIVSCSLWAYAVFAFYNLWLDAILQLFYVAMSFWGLYRWRRGDRETKKSVLLITRLTGRQHFFILLTGSGISVLLGYVFAAFTPTASPYADAFLTTFSIFTTFLLAQKKLDNWLYWVVIDIGLAYLYFSRGGYLLALLMVVYVVLAVVAYFEWRREEGRGKRVRG